MVCNSQGLQGWAAKTAERRVKKRAERLQAEQQGGSHFYLHPHPAASREVKLHGEVEVRKGRPFLPRPVIHWRARLKALSLELVAMLLKDIFKGACFPTRRGLKSHLCVTQRSDLIVDLILDSRSSHVESSLFFISPFTYCSNTSYSFIYFPLALSDTYITNRCSLCQHICLYSKEHDRRCTFSLYVHNLDKCVLSNIVPSQEHCAAETLPGGKAGPTGLRGPVRRQE